MSLERILEETLAYAQLEQTMKVRRDKLKAYLNANSRDNCVLPAILEKNYIHKHFDIPIILYNMEKNDALL